MNYETSTTKKTSTLYLETKGKCLNDIDINEKSALLLAHVVWLLCTWESGTFEHVASGSLRFSYEVT